MAPSGEGLLPAATTPARATPSLPEPSPPCPCCSLLCPYWEDWGHVHRQPVCCLPEAGGWALHDLGFHSSIYFFTLFT